MFSGLVTGVTCQHPKETEVRILSVIRVERLIICSTAETNLLYPLIFCCFKLSCKRLQLKSPTNTLIQ